MPGDLQSVLAASRAPMHEIDLVRMRADRLGRLRAQMDTQGVELLVLLHHPHVTYATGAVAPATDVTHAVFERSVALVTPEALRLHSDRFAGVEVDIDVLPPVWPELDEGASALRTSIAELVGDLGGRRVAVDEQTGAMLRQGVLEGADLADAGNLVAAAKICKTADELACIAEAQRRNEMAMVETRRALVPGATRSTVVGRFLRRLRELGVDANMIDPIIEVMPRRLVDGPRTTTGGVAFPTGVGDPTFAEGDLVWVDTGVGHHGYVSDFGRTWLVGREPDDAERALFDRWCDVMSAVLACLRPGVSGGELCRVATRANRGERPWLSHFYLAHGVGIESAEMPLLGTDLGEEFDESLVMAPGMVLVLEPVVWEEGLGGYRSEEIVAVTDDGWCHLGSGHGYEPFR